MSDEFGINEGLPGVGENLTGWLNGIYQAPTLGINFREPWPILEPDT